MRSSTGLGRRCRGRSRGNREPHDPVRWWRDDATRYKSRPPYQAPPVDQGPRWAFELLRHIDPELTRMLDRWLEASSPAKIAAALAMPLELLVGGCSCRSAQLSKFSCERIPTSSTASSA
jgi:hypothetical protein